MWWGQWPGARGLGPGLGFKYEFFAGRAWTYVLRSGPGPGLMIQFAGRTRARSAQLLRASNHICSRCRALVSMLAGGSAVYAPLLWSSLRCDSYKTRVPVVCIGLMAEAKVHGQGFAFRSCLCSTAGVLINGGLGCSPRKMWWPIAVATIMIGVIIQVRAD